MMQALLGGVLPEEMQRFLADVAQGKPVALTGMTEAQGTLVAAQMAVRAGKRVLLVLPNDLGARPRAWRGARST